MSAEKILMVADGIIVLVNDTDEWKDIRGLKNVSFTIEDFGVVLKTSGGEPEIPLPGIVLDHLVNADDTKIHIYGVEPYSLLGNYLGALPVDRDELLKAKGGWEYIPH